MSKVPHSKQRIQGVEKQAMDQAFKDSLKGFMSKDTQIQKQIEEAVYQLEGFDGDLHEPLCQCVNEEPDACDCEMFGLKKLFRNSLQTIASKSAEKERRKVLTKAHTLFESCLYGKTRVEVGTPYNFETSMVNITNFDKGIEALSKEEHETSK